MLDFLVYILMTGGAIGLAAWWAYKTGQEKTRATQSKQINQAVEKAIHVRDRLQRDPSFFERVRRRFTR